MNKYELGDKIRELFNKPMSRKQIQKELGLDYNTVYFATINMTNKFHKRGKRYTTKSLVPKMNINLKFVDEDGNEVDSAKDAAMVERNEIIRELFEKGLGRNTIAKLYDIKYITVYKITRDIEATDTNTITVDGVETKVEDYCKQMYRNGMKRSEIAYMLSKLTGKYFDYQMIYQMTKED